MFSEFSLGLKNLENLNRKQEIGKILRFLSQMFTWFNFIFNILCTCKLNPILGLVHLLHFHVQQLLRNAQHYN